MNPCSTETTNYGLSFGPRVRARSGVGAALLLAALASAGCSQGTEPRTENDPSQVVGGEGPSGTSAAPAWAPPAAAPAQSPVAEHGQLAVTGAHLVDSAGVNVQLKGVSSMWLNWESRPYAENEEGLAWLRDNWNLSLLRAIFE
jgi:hypothetical protein